MSDAYVGIAPFDQTEGLDHLDYLDPSYVSKPVAFYGEDSGLIHVFVECAERLVASYQNLGEYEPPNAQMDLTPENALELRDWLTKALAAWRKDTKNSEGGS